jgi:hypothetical protein
MYLEKQDADKVLKKFHDGPTRGNFAGKTKNHKIMRVGYHWPTMFKDAQSYSHSYYIFQKYVKREIGFVFSLQPIVFEELLEHYDLEIISEINHHSSIKKRYILSTNDYFT